MPRISFLTGIIVTLTVFILTGLGFALYTTTLQYDLVQDDYYGADLNYQSIIDAKKRTAALPEIPNIIFDNSIGSVVVEYPESIADESPAGTIVLYRPSNAGLDFETPIQPGPSNMQTINLPKSIIGLWTVKMTWELNGLVFYLEKSIYALK